MGWLEPSTPRHTGYGLAMTSLAFMLVCGAARKTASGIYIPPAIDHFLRGTDD
jgi:hypothetical protein